VKEPFTTNDTKHTKEESHFYRFSMGSFIKALVRVFGVFRGDESFFTTKEENSF
jgi:hypothetical protein